MGAAAIAKKKKKKKKEKEKITIAIITSMSKYTHCPKCQLLGLLRKSANVPWTYSLSLYCTLGHENLPGEWSRWFDADNPSGNCDCEVRGHQVRGQTIRPTKIPLKMPVMYFFYGKE